MTRKVQVTITCSIAHPSLPSGRMLISLDKMQTSDGQNVSRASFDLNTHRLETEDVEVVRAYKECLQLIEGAMSNG